MAEGRASRVWYVILGGLVLLGVVALLVGLPEGVPILSRLIQAAALVGYTCIFLAIVSSAFTRELVRAFGRPFVRVHHWVSITGEAMVWAHPLLVALEAGSLAVFIPSFASWRLFWSLGGRVAWYLIGVAVMAALLRKVIGRNWRRVHWLNYVAFILATPHALLIGSTFSRNPWLRVFPVLMLIIVLGVFVRRHLWKRPRG